MDAEPGEVASAVCQVCQGFGCEERQSEIRSSR